MRFIEDGSQWRRLELSLSDVEALKRGASIGDGRSLIVQVAEPMKLKTWVMRTEVCESCDRPEVCAIIKAGTSPCGRNRHLSLEEQK